jgi:hypothetical protein
MFYKLKEIVFDDLGLTTATSIGIYSVLNLEKHELTAGKLAMLASHTPEQLFQVATIINVAKVYQKTGFVFDNQAVSERYLPNSIHSVAVDELMKNPILEQVAIKALGEDFNDFKSLFVAQAVALLDTEIGKTMYSEFHKGYLENSGESPCDPSLADKTTLTLLEELNGEGKNSNRNFYLEFENIICRLFYPDILNFREVIALTRADCRNGNSRFTGNSKKERTGDGNFSREELKFFERLKDVLQYFANDPTSETVVKYILGVQRQNQLRKVVRDLIDESSRKSDGYSNPILSVDYFKTNGNGLIIGRICRTWFQINQRLLEIEKNDFGYNRDSDSGNNLRSVVLDLLTVNISNQGDDELGMAVNNVTYSLLHNIIQGTNKEQAMDELIKWHDLIAELLPANMNRRYIDSPDNPFTPSIPVELRASFVALASNYKDYRPLGIVDLSTIPNYSQWKEALSNSTRELVQALAVQLVEDVVTRVANSELFRMEKITSAIEVLTNNISGPIRWLKTNIDEEGFFFK